MLWEQQNAGSQANGARVRCYEGEGDYRVQYAVGRWHALRGLGEHMVFTCPQGVGIRPFQLPARGAQVLLGSWLLPR